MRNRTRLVVALGWGLAVALRVGSVSADDTHPGGPALLLTDPTPGVETSLRGTPGPCSRTSTAMLRACKADVQDTYWTEFGKCLNVADDAARATCMAEAYAAYQEGQTECTDQFDAREAVCGALGQAPYDPIIVPGNFQTPEAAAENPHPYFPLVPGTTWRYVHGSETIDVMVTDQTVEIRGVKCFVVTDVVRNNGEITEDTVDWYALDVDGNVWYFGEHSETWENGEMVSLDGSWKAGRDGARPGIVMKASPAVTETYRQEFLLADAEDMAQVLSITGTELVPGAACNGDCVVTREFTPVEPGSEAHKYYASSVGIILEVDPVSGDREELTEFHPGPAPSSDTRATRPPVRGLLSGVQVGAPSADPTSAARTAIQFDLAREADVNVDVYDPAGRRIRSLFVGRRDAGRHTLEWQGTDDGGQPVAKGVYFVRIRAGAESQTGKVALLAR